MQAQVLYIGGKLMIDILAVVNYNVIAGKEGGEHATKEARASRIGKP